MNVSSGRVVAGRYHVEAILGHGGMGDVYAGEDLRLGRPVAVKLLRSDTALDSGSRRRFEREAQMAARVGHPNIVAIYDVGEDDVPFIVMERLPGRTLADEFLEGPLDVERLHLLAGEMLSALAAAHAKGVLHRDIKPTNVLLTADQHVKVADFGIAKSADDISETTTVFGTAGYVAPERLTGHAATAQSDLFSLGVVLYQAAAGQKPFAGDSPMATVHALVYEQPVPLATIRPDLDGAFVSTVERSMRKDPRERFATATDMAFALQHPDASTHADETVGFLATGPTTAPFVPVAPTEALGTSPAPAAPPRSREPSGNRRTALLLTLLVLVGIAFAGWAATRGGDSPVSPVAPSTSASTNRAVAATSTSPPNSTSPARTIPAIAPTVPPTVPPTRPGTGNQGNGNGKGNGNAKAREKK